MQNVTHAINKCDLRLTSMKVLVVANKLLRGSNIQFQTRVSTLQLLCKIVRTMPPEAIAMSRKVFLRLSPKPGAFTAHTCSPTLILTKQRQRYILTILKSNKE